METIGERLKIIRKNNNLTQAAFGEAIGVTKQAIANIESNHSNPSIDFLGKLIENFNVNVNWLISGKGKFLINEFSFYNMPDNEFEIKVREVLKKEGLI